MGERIGAVGARDGQQRVSAGAADSDVAEALMQVAKGGGRDAGAQAAQSSHVVVD